MVVTSSVSSMMESSSVPPNEGCLPSLEVWKRVEFLRFGDHLRSIEEELKQQMVAEIAKVRRIEKRLKQRLAELEAKENELKFAELEIKRGREEMANRIKKIVDDHNGQIKILTEQHASALKIEKDKLKTEELKRRSAEVELARLKNEAQVRDRRGGVVVVNGVAKKSTKAPPTTVVNKPMVVSPEYIASAVSDTNVLRAELARTLEREQLLIKSRDHFRNAVIRLAATEVRPPADLLGEHNRSVKDTSSSVLHMQARRADLLASGVYAETDPVIQQIDRQIAQKFS